MASDSQAPGLRERKKMKTREAIRREALRLYEANGYPGTTVEQIAQAADVSPSTFFRYFSNKAALLIPDQLMEPIIEAFLKAPPELSPVAAYRQAVEQMFTNMASVEWAPEMARQRLLYSTICPKRCSPRAAAMAKSPSQTLSNSACSVLRAVQRVR